jgi:hypothetical protein
MCGFASGLCVLDAFSVLLNGNDTGPGGSSVHIVMGASKPPQDTTDSLSPQHCTERHRNPDNLYSNG